MAELQETLKVINYQILNKKSNNKTQKIICLNSNKKEFKYELQNKKESLKNQKQPAPHLVRDTL